MNGKIVKEGITFDDVLLIPAKSDVLPNEVSLKTRLTKKITLNLPILSAAMDTVTESDLAIALARQGGIGFIHKNMSIEEQAAEVDRVKRSESGMITNPITLNKDSRVYQAEELMSRYKISGLPVIEDDGKLIGIITNRDIKYRKDLDQPVGDIMTSKGLITAPVGTTLEQAKEILLANRIEKLPITDQNGYLKGLITIKDIDNIIQYPNACKDELGKLRCGAAVGVASDTIERVSALVKAGVDIVTVDSAHGHSQGVINMIKEINKILLNRLNHNAGNFKTDYNYIRGADFETASPSETPYKMNEWFENMNFQLKSFNSDDEKLKIILEYHIKFERIHPFSDGNGRTGRLIMLALMLENNLTPFVITVENRAKYMDILRNQDIENFVSLVEPLIEEEKKRIIAFKKSSNLQI